MRPRDQRNGCSGDENGRIETVKHRVYTVSRQHNEYYSLRFFYSGGFPELASLFSVLVVKRSFKVLLFLLEYVLKRVVAEYSRDAWLADFIFCEFRKLFFVIRDLKVLRDSRRPLLTGYLWFYRDSFCDFKTRVLRMVRVNYREWLRYANWNKEPSLSLSRSCFLQVFFLV